MSMYELPVSVTIENTDFTIRNNGDYRMVLDCFGALEDLELTKEERIFASLMIFYADLDTLEDVYASQDILGDLYNGMVTFFNCGREPDEDSGRSNYKLVDWERDAALVCSAVNRVAGREIRNESYLHWWTFMGYYMAIGECALSNVVGIRYKLAKNRKLEKYERKFMQDNPQYFKDGTMTAEQREADAYVRNIWNNGGKI